MEFSPSQSQETLWRPTEKLVAPSTSIDEPIDKLGHSRTLPDKVAFSGPSLLLWRLTLKP